MTPIAYINVENRTLEFAKNIFWHTPTVANIDRIPLFTKEALAQEQEPVKIIQYNCTCGRTMKFESVHGVVAPQRTFVGLTDEVITKVIDSMPKKMRGFMDGWDLYDFTRAIEAKLKEKNT